MENEKKHELTMRLSQCNKSGLILVMYDIYFAFSNDFYLAFEKGDETGKKKSVGDAQAALDELIGALDFNYDIAKQLFELYSYCKKLFSKCLYENSVKPAEEADKIMSQLRESFEKVAKSDDSDPIMANTQKVYTGMTYGRTQLGEDYVDGTQRGFLV